MSLFYSHSQFFLFALNSISLSILNGQGEIKKFVTVNIFNSLFSLIITSILIINLDLLGALYALVINQSVVFFVTLFFIWKSPWFKLSYFVHGFDKESLNKLSKFSVMAITSSITIPVSHIVVRNYIGENFGWEYSGYWQGVWYISTMYLLVITTALNVYFLPKISSIDDIRLVKKEILNGIKLIIPIVTILASLVYFFRISIINIAFTENFLDMEILFKWQLIGDVIKITAWIFGYILIAKAMTKIYIFTEIFFSILFIIITIIFIEKFGFIGISYSFSLHSLLYLIYLILILNYFYFKKEVFL